MSCVSATLLFKKMATIQEWYRKITSNINRLYEYKFRKNKIVLKGLGRATDTKKLMLHRTIHISLQHFVEKIFFSLSLHQKNSTATIRNNSNKKNMCFVFNSFYEKIMNKNLVNEVAMQLVEHAPGNGVQKMYFVTAAEIYEKCMRKCFKCFSP